VPDNSAEKLVIAVDLTIGGDPDRFMRLMATNAATSLQDEPGCRQFDVCVDVSDPSHVLLYEIYDDDAAFTAHLASPHYRSFDAETRALIVRKVVQRYRLRAG
jgi:quinol monooxygenase YgiN